MSTKGPSNHYGNANHGRQGHATEHTGFAWAKGFNKNTLKGHFGDHGKEVGASNANYYAAKAVHFANAVNKKDCITKKDKHGTTYKYNKKTNEFAIITKKGVVITYYKPKGGYEYFKKQGEN